MSGAMSPERRFTDELISDEQAARVSWRAARNGAGELDFHSQSGPQLCPGSASRMERRRAPTRMSPRGCRREQIERFARRRPPLLGRLRIRRSLSHVDVDADEFPVGAFEGIPKLESY